MGLLKKYLSRKTIPLDHKLYCILLMSGTAADKKSSLPKHPVQLIRNPVRTGISGNTSMLILIVKKLTFAEHFSAFLQGFTHLRLQLVFFLVFLD